MRQAHGSYTLWPLARRSALKHNPLIQRRYSLPYDAPLQTVSPLTPDRQMPEWAPHPSRTPARVRLTGFWAKTLQTEKLLLPPPECGYPRKAASDLLHRFSSNLRA